MSRLAVILVLPCVVLHRERWREPSSYKVQDAHLEPGPSRLHSIYIFAPHETKLEAEAFIVEEGGE